MARRSNRLLIILGVTAIATSGASCFPLIDLGSPGNDPPDPPTALTVAIIKPGAAREVPEGTVVRIEWTMNNGTASDAIAEILVRDRRDLTNTVIAGGVRIRGAGSRQTTDWDTAGFAGGRFQIIVRVTAGDETVEAMTESQVTINAAPSFEFTEPFENVLLGEDFEPDPNAPDEQATVTIRWTGFDLEGTAALEIFADPDADHESGNELSLVQAVLTATAEIDTFEWDGSNTDASEDEDTTYTLFATVDDGVNPAATIEGLAQITVPLDTNKTFSLEFQSPDEDIEFLTDDDPLAIEFTFDESDDVLIDLGIDVDDVHTNGNEQLILFQRLVEKDTNEESFDWAGTDRDGDAVDDAIYRVYIVVNRGSGTPQTLNADGLVFRRSKADAPLIAMLEPSSDKTKDAGEFETLKWRDDDPDETATVRLTLDDDEFADEAVETDNDEIEILADRDAKGDGVQDTFAYQVPNDLAPGTYFIFAYIDEDGSAPYDHVSTAAGQIIIKDPAE